MGVPSVILNWQELADLIVDDIHITTPDYSEVIEKLNKTVELLVQLAEASNRAPFIYAKQLDINSNDDSHAIFFTHTHDIHISAFAFSCSVYYHSDTVSISLYKDVGEEHMIIFHNINVKNMLQRKVLNYPLRVPAGHRLKVQFNNFSHTSKYFNIDLEYSIQRSDLE